MGSEALLKSLIEEFKKNPQSEDFPDNARKQVRKFFSSTKASQIDAKKLNSQAVFLSKLRQACIALNIHPPAYDSEIKQLEGQFPDSPELAEFKKLDLQKQVKFMQHWSSVSNPPEVILELESIKLLPRALIDLKLTPRERKELAAIRDVRLKTNHLRIAGEAVTTEGKKQTVDGNKVLDRIMTMPDGTPALLSNDKKRLLVALLFATGRREVECLTTMELWPDKTQTDPENAYSALFGGQAKKGGVQVQPYRIPLLAPFWLVEKAFLRLDDLFPGAYGLSREAFHKKYAMFINRAVKDVIPGATAHSLRGLYALMCAKLYDCGGMVDAENKPDMKGYIATILGHSNEKSAEHYNRAMIDNLTRPYITLKPSEAKVETKTETRGDNVAVDFDTEPTKAAEVDLPWHLHGRAENKKVRIVEAMMKEKEWITQSACMRWGKNHGFGAGKAGAWKAFLANNEAIVDQYNASLQNTTMNA